MQAQLTRIKALVDSKNQLRLSFDTALQVSLTVHILNVNFVMTSLDHLLLATSVLGFYCSIDVSVLTSTHFISKQQNVKCVVLMSTVLLL